MCMADLYDGGYNPHHVTVRIARKRHECGECRRPIQPGESYEHQTGFYDGRWDTNKTCAHCEAARGWLADVCGGWLYQGVLEDLEQHWDEDATFRTLTLGRLILGMRSRWVRDGRPVPVPDFRVPRRLLGTL